jgi:spore germination cell wall hydrolase CwlJ-like protein
MTSSFLCLALAVYYEARSEPIRAQIAVAQVIMQRVESERYPNDVCEVVKEGEYWPNGVPIRHKCQFSFWCDGEGETMRDRIARRRARAVASLVASGFRIPELTFSLHYHATYANPFWASKMRPVATIGNHIFYIEER